MDNTNSDGDFASAIGGKYSVGIGIPPTVDPASLAAQIDAMKRARPVGLARLVVLERYAQAPKGPTSLDREYARVLFSSRVLCTFDDDPHQNYTVPRYVWSLRNLPARALVEAWWVIFTPTGRLAYEMWRRGARKSSWDAIAAHWGGRTQLVCGVTHTRAGQAIVTRTLPRVVEEIAMKTHPGVASYRHAPGTSGTPFEYSKKLQYFTRRPASNFIDGE